MSCEAVAAAVLLWFAAAPGEAPAQAPAPAVALEPLFAEIVAKANALHAEVVALQAQDGAAAADFAERVGALAAMDMQGHRLLAERGVDGDLKCILRGIAEDLPVKLAALQAAKDPAARDRALSEMAYLLDDNAAVLLAPQPAV